MKITRNHTFILIGITILALTQVLCKMPMKEDEALDVAEEVLDEIAEDLENEIAPAQVDSCDGTYHLYVDSQITEQETNQFGTRLCSYKLTITNNGDEVVWFYIYQHDKDGYQRTEKSQWMGNFPINPGENIEWQGTISIYTDEDFDGPVMSIPEKIAGVYGTPECVESRQDEDFHEKIAVPIRPACPLE